MSAAKWCVIALVGLACGCATMQQMSSGQVGCPPEEITIADESSGFGTSSWTAECRGQRFYCSSVTSNPMRPAYGSLQVSCRPEAARASRMRKEQKSPAAQGGCSYDTQCKGDRICVDGRCVDSASSKSAISVSSESSGEVVPAAATEPEPVPINPNPPQPSSRKPLGKSSETP